MGVVGPDYHARFDRQKLDSKQLCPNQGPDDHVALLRVTRGTLPKPEGALPDSTLPGV
jgi:hypothetical protein